MHALLGLGFDFPEKIRAQVQSSNNSSQIYEALVKWREIASDVYGFRDWRQLKTGTQKKNRRIIIRYFILKK